MKACKKSCPNLIFSPASLQHAMKRKCQPQVKQRGRQRLAKQARNSIHLFQQIDRNLLQTMH
ncbi:hypothetical protein BCR33DRAFT_421902 [Rhizoclosmatium globosum]|uniref:Uncharacterized protein n=1 Tax=Rhizoclosmatium globosum TaxID=329046 RepID=A0A1Y2BXM0_9FUNG|nr:hypothetical protein BCR33DRAFT_421902 [Rhizoclosmatium globosum]|eukprot:ORY38835.1 hypothetical protein BCR33DRAFT_421902 [Rhizoclosmatium globosum]